VGDVKKVLARVLEELKGSIGEKTRNEAERAAWWQKVKEWMREHPLEPSMDPDTIKPQHLMAEIDRLSGGEAIITSDVGQHQMWAAQLIKFNHPRLWLNSGGLGSMGFGLPSAIGAQFARPDKLVFAICGDGGFQMSIPELATVANHALPVKIIVMNNGYLGMISSGRSCFTTIGCRKRSWIRFRIRRSSQALMGSRDGQSKGRASCAVRSKKRCASRVRIS